MSKKIKVGDVCIFNKDGDIHMSSDKIIYVKVKEIKKRFLRPNKNNYVCNICTKEGEILNDRSMNIPASLITPFDQDVVVVIRYPEDVPIINEEDLMLINEMGKMCINNLTGNQVDTLSKLITKLKLFVTVINEY